MSSFRYFEQIFKIRFRYNLMSVFQIFVLPIIIRAKKSWTKNKRCTPHSSLNLKRDKKSSLWCTNRKCTMMMKRAEKWPFPQAKNTIWRSYFQHLDPHFTGLAWGDKRTEQTKICQLPPSSKYSDAPTRKDKGVALL